jgi:hypothetical protein
MESPRTAELCNKLYKTKEEHKIFLGFRFLKARTKANSKQSKNLFGFSNGKLTRRLSKPKTKNQRNNQRETTEIFLVFLYFGKQEQSKNNKRKKESETWIYKEPTEYDM